MQLEHWPEAHFYLIAQSEEISGCYMAKISPKVIYSISSKDKGTLEANATNAEQYKKRGFSVACY